MEKETRCAIVIAFFFALSLSGAVVLFSYLESYAEVVNPTYQLGGAAAGFFVIFITLFGAYSKLIGKSPPALMKEASKAIAKPKGFTEYRSTERGFSIYYPKSWKLTEQEAFPPVFFEMRDGTNINIITQKAEKKWLNKLEEDPSVFSDYYERVFETTFKGIQVLEKLTIAMHGKQCPMFVTKRAIDDENALQQIQICYLDFRREKMHWISCTTDRAQYEHMKPVFEKIISTFEPL